MVDRPRPLEVVDPAGVAIDESDRGIEIRPLPERQIVESRDRIAACRQDVAGIRADEAGAARDQDPYRHRRSSSGSVANRSRKATLMSWLRFFDITSTASSVSMMIRSCTPIATTGRW